MSQLKRRTMYVVKPGDTLVSIAAQALLDERLGWLVFQLNIDGIKHIWRGKICVAALTLGQKLELPNAKDVQRFRVQRQSYPDVDYLVSVVEDSEIRKELLVQKLRHVIEGRHSHWQSKHESASSNVIIVDFDRSAVSLND